MRKIDSIVAVAVPVVAALILGFVGKHLLTASVDMPTSCLAGMMAVCTAVLCGMLSVVAALLVKVIGNQTK